MENNEQYKRAKKIIEDRHEALELIAQALIDYETIEGKHVHEILDHGEIRSPVIVRPEVKSEPEEEESPAGEEKKVADKKPGEELGPSTEPAMA